MATLEDARVRAQQTYNAASDSYDDPANAFWERFGRRTIERLDLAPGMHVLDVCCGSGASALPAAARVGLGGSVLAVDLAQNLLDLGRAKAARLGLTNIEFRAGDMLDLGLPERAFDVVVCVFGIFFVPDSAAAVRELWRMVRPGGRLAITTWGPDLFEPANTAFWQSVKRVRPDLYKGFNPWDRFVTREAVRGLFAEAGASVPEVALEEGWHPIAGPTDWWTLVMGSGYRGTVEQLDEAQRASVRETNLAYVGRGGVGRVRTDVIYAVGRK